jgi:hypothetical protein
MTEDFTDPGYLRHCMLPDCGESFNIGELYSGLTKAPGWCQLNRVASGYLCPAHAPLATDAGHLPHWLNPRAEPGMCGIGCACGWKWQPAVPTNAGGHHERWRTHLAALAASRNNPNPAQTLEGKR